MSTFKGIIEEFPQIRIDYFRQQPGHKAPLACFLSHIHSDHLVGLESLRAPFVYCSAATREILLRLEKYHYRVNFARGILESRNVTYDRSMRKLAKPLPLDTPTTLELTPGNKICVTLIDANHCVGAVMFLIEGDGKAVLYTGDIRAEKWWVNSLVQNPVLFPYTHGFRRLDCMYLDTTFATKSMPYRDFPSKADGIKELLDKVQVYPNDTVFYFHSWTFGYENVWIALSNFLGSRIHLDDYRTRIYASLSTLDKNSLREVGLDVRSDNKYLRESGLEIREAPPLCGFRHGNHVQPGCLTSLSNVRIHSCERGMGCPVVDHDTEARAVHIIPIVIRIGGIEIAELGAGGGKGDLDQKEELDTNDAVDVGKLMELCTKSIKDSEILSRVLSLLQQTLDNGNSTIDLDMDLQKESQENEGGLSLQTLVSVLSSHASKSQDSERQLNRSIRFPYSRHSSYYELCCLVAAFRPKDVYPCTVNECRWDPELGMRHLFGAFCSDDIFRHDTEMMAIHEARLERESNAKREGKSQQDTQSSVSNTTSPVVIKRARLGTLSEAPILIEEKEEPVKFFTPVETILPAQRASSPGKPGIFSGTSPIEPPSIIPISVPETTNLSDPEPPPQPAPPFADTSRVSTLATRSVTETPSTNQIKKRKMTNRELAYEAALGMRLTWADYGGLVSTRTKAEREEEEL
ncbi:hypothetical protein K458DRAFT_344171 [Lentithecium fluviatile CBS 122367]|uniref:Protein artemis n=1 Tax=Lentithecium fluviatile CBS 122367 TaxID=1168545 RepID=A0A6G1IS39_9PLEO|nr:hypothetical protein K458DRAFT_344171 [Lentithecium fluviatile CBS 122367]